MIRIHREEKYSLTAKAELSWLRGNASPYFSLTGHGRDHGSEFGGCCHDDILKLWPDLQPLADIHLSDLDGAPMYAEANGWYWLAGVIGGAGERYAPKESTFDCLVIFANHCRVDLAEACDIAALVNQAWNYPDMKARWKRECDSMRPRWKQEADAAIKEFNLEVPKAPQ